MKSVTKEDTQRQKAYKQKVSDDAPRLREQLMLYKREKEILLTLSNDITRVRDKNDLVRVFSSRLKQYFYFTHAVISLINQQKRTYYPFLMDRGSMHIRHRSELPSLLKMQFVIDDPFISQVADPDMSASFLLDDIISKPGVPAFLKVNYECGIRKAMIVKLKSKMETIGHVLLYSDKTDSFPDDFKSILEGIAPHLSNAVANIIINEEISEKDKDKTFLIEFSHDIASARTKEELSKTIHQSLKKLGQIRAYFIRTINNDNITLSPFMHDNEVHYKDDPGFKKLLNTRINKNEGITGRALKGNGPLFIDFEEEVKQGNTDHYIEFWKGLGAQKAAFQKMVGVALRAGNIDLGVLWVITNEINVHLLEGISAQIAIAIANIQANEKLLAYKKQLEVENDYLKEQIQTIYNFSDIIGSGPEMEKVYHLMSLVAESNSTVLLLGETGTGKELIARAIHNASPRKSKLMVKVNCAALPANLIESELFGHERGAFTGAIERRIGKFELANNSTLFLDEIGEMPLETQVKLLRVLQERELERVGGKTTIKVDVRIIAATNRNLEQEVKSGRFRSDLYYRLNVFPIALPPLRERPEDISPLAHFFLERYSKNSGKKVVSISPGCMQELKSYTWPGNVRELEHLIERSILLTPGNVLTEIQLPKGSAGNKNDHTNASGKTLEELERTYIIEVLKRCSGKISGRGGAAAALGTPATTLHSKMKKLGIAKADYFLKENEF